MGLDSTEVISTKLDILIRDFHRFRDEDVVLTAAKNKIISKKEESAEQDRKDLAIAKTTLIWHTIIGTFIMSVLAFHIAQHGL